MNRTTRRLKRVVWFFFDQTLKTIRRPTRVFIIIFGFARAGFLRYFGSKFALLLRLVPSYTMPSRIKSISAEINFAEGALLLEQNRPHKAWQLFRACLKTSTQPQHFFVAAACLLVGLGRYQKAMALFSRANALRLKRAKALGIAKSQIRFLENIWTGAFGHLAQIQYLVKLNILENRRREDTILYVPHDTPVANRFLLDQWQPYLNIIENASDLPLPLDALHLLSFDFLAPRLTDGSTVYYWEAAETVNRRWQAENRGPVLTLSQDIKERGVSTLAAAGIPRDAWFVALHVRESTSKQLHSDLHNVLNGQIADYLPAIKEITDRGGWVVRMGDPKMKTLSAMPNVFDYCHSSARSEWMDIFLLARSRFFLGTSSGPAYVPPIYQVPTVLTNWWPPAQLPWDNQAIFLPKLYRHLRSGAVLPLSRALTEPFGYCNSIDQFKESEGITVEDNSPEDIRDAVVEMIERLEGIAKYSEEDLRLREKAAQIFKSNGAHGMGDLARDFLLRNRCIVD